MTKTLYYILEPMTAILEIIRMMTDWKKITKNYVSTYAEDRG